jgi:transcriptional regulator with XRE-family HTH domain
MDTRHKLGRRIKELRKQACLTQEELAGRVDIAPRHLSRLERGVHYPSLDTLEMIALTLRAPLREFFTFPDDETPEMLRNRLMQTLGAMDDSELRRVAKVLKSS